jgi:hypothetical protein
LRCWVAARFALSIKKDGQEKKRGTLDVGGKEEEVQLFLSVHRVKSDTEEISVDRVTFCYDI